MPLPLFSLSVAPSKILCQDYRVRIMFNASYHPQANPTERTNRVLNTMVASYIKDSHRNWDNFLLKVGCAIRTSVSEVTELTRYFVNFGREYVTYGNLYKNRFCG